MQPQPQTETQTWQVDGAQLRYIHAMLTQAGMTPQWQAAGHGSYVLVVVVPVGWDLPAFLDGQRGAPRRRSWWRRLDPTALMIPVSLATVALLGWLLINGAPAALTAALPAGIDPPVVVLPPAIADPLAGVRESVDAAVAGLVVVGQMVAVLVALVAVFVFRRPLAAAGGALMKVGSMFKGKKDARE